MVQDNNIGMLISDIVNSKQFSHCRLCLKDIKASSYVHLEDEVYSEIPGTGVQVLSEVINSILDEKIEIGIPALDAVCTNCADIALKCAKFIENCNNSNDILHQLINNLRETLDFDTNILTEDKNLYVIVNKEGSVAVLVDDTNKNQCKECDIEFKSPEDLLQHNKIQHLTCEECEKYFSNISELIAHKDDPSNHKCHVNQHNKIQHLTCEECEECFSNISELIAHKDDHNNHKCPKCHIHKPSAESLQEHDEQVHFTYLCKDCGKPCIGLEKLKSHEEKHTSANKNKCPKCGKVYMTKNFYIKHVKLCLEDRIDPHPYRAKIVKTYSCDKCSKKYSTPGGLRVHDRFVHGNAQPHVCEHCGKAFTAPSYLKIHMTKHTGEKKFKCGICGHNLVSKEALLYHTRRHTGEKPYSCKVCNEKFVNASARAEHHKFKHAAPRLTCNICLKKFYMANFLKQHMQRHHDPRSKLYAGRHMIPPNVPAEENMRIKLDVSIVEDNSEDNDS